MGVSGGLSAVPERQQVQRDAASADKRGIPRPATVARAGRHLPVNEAVDRGHLSTVAALRASIQPAQICGDRTRHGSATVQIIQWRPGRRRLTGEDEHG